MSVAVDWFVVRRAVDGRAAPPVIGASDVFSRASRPGLTYAASPALSGEASRIFGGRAVLVKGGGYDWC